MIYIHILLQDDDLYKAVEKQNIAKTESLLNKGANPNSKHGDVSYHIHIDSDTDTGLQLLYFNMLHPFNRYIFIQFKQSLKLI